MFLKICEHWFLILSEEYNVSSQSNYSKFCSYSSSIFVNKANNYLESSAFFLAWFLDVSRELNWSFAHKFWIILKLRI